MQRNYIWKDDITLFEDSARKSPLNTRAWLNLSAAYGTAGRTDDAMRAIEKVLSLYPEPGAFLNLGRIMEDNKRPDEALMFYKEAIKMADSASLNEEMRKAVKRHSYFAIGNIYYGKNDYESAEYYYLKSINTDPEYAIAWNNLGYVFLIQKKCKEAVSALETALRLRPEDRLAAENLDLAKGCQKGNDLRIRQ